MKQKNKLYNDAVLADLYYEHLGDSNENNRTRLLKMKPENVDAAAMQTAMERYLEQCRTAMVERFLPPPQT